MNGLGLAGARTSDISSPLSVRRHPRWAVSVSGKLGSAGQDAGERHGRGVFGLDALINCARDANETRGAGFLGIGFAGKRLKSHLPTRPPSALRINN